jgi:hypothetical protein
MISEQSAGQVPVFYAGDILLFAGKAGDLYTRLGGWIMRSPGESPPYALHAAQFLDQRRVLEMDFVGRVKSLDDILQQRVDLNTWQRRGFEVWRCRTLSAEQREQLTDQALRYINIRFGYLKMIAHLMDGLLTKLTRRDLFIFRKLDPDGSSPVCSGVTAFVYDRALHYRFGVEPECADPDHIHDWLTSHPDEWERIFAVDNYAQRR